MKTRRKYGFKKFIRRIENKGKEKVYCDLPPILIMRTQVQRVLKGDVAALITAFTWSGTPQRSHYWNRVHSRLEPLSLSDIAFLNYLLDPSNKIQSTEWLEPNEERVSLSKWEVNYEED